MPTFELHTRIAAPVERVFDLARCIELHEASTARTRERAVGGVTSGLIGAGERVTWEATHFGVRQRLTSEITAYDRPRHFRDSMVAGAFRRFDHDHWFLPDDAGGTHLHDVFDYRAPLGPLGRLAEFAFLTAYLRRFLSTRNAHLKLVAETDAWRRYLATPTPGAA